jgi:hypothetical protein
MRTLIQRLLRFWTTATYVVVTRGAVLAVLVVGFYFTFRLVIHPIEDPTRVTNVAFGITATLAALCFSCARAVEQPTEDKDRFTFAGERFLHSAICVLSASILQYGLSEATRGHYVEQSKPLWLAPISALPGILFFWALTMGHTGLRVVSQLLWRRLSRHKDWDDLW